MKPTVSRGSKTYVGAATRTPACRLAIDAGDGVVASISVFENQEEAERSDEAAADWVKDNLADVVEGPPEITAGEILVFAPRPAVW